MKRKGRRREVGGEEEVTESMLLEDQREEDLMQKLSDDDPLYTKERVREAMKAIGEDLLTLEILPEVQKQLKEDLMEDLLQDEEEEPSRKVVRVREGQHNPVEVNICLLKLKERKGDQREEDLMQVGGEEEVTESMLLEDQREEDLMQKLSDDDPLYTKERVREAMKAIGEDLLTLEILPEVQKQLKEDLMEDLLQDEGEMKEGEAARDQREEEFMQEMTDYDYGEDEPITEAIETSYGSVDNLLQGMDEDEQPALTTTAPASTSSAAATVKRIPTQAEKDKASYKNQVFCLSSLKSGYLHFCLRWRGRGPIPMG